MTTFKKQIKRVNPGRKIEVDKICPHIGTACIKDKCNAYSLHHEINIVSYEEKMQQEAKGIDWEKSIDINDWKKHAENKLTNISDDACDTLYIRKSYGSAGRCLIK